MNTTDLRTLLTAPTVSRATFFAYYLGTAKNPAEATGTDLQPPAGQPVPTGPPAAPNPAPAEAKR